MKKILLVLLLFPGPVLFAQNPDIDLLRSINQHRNPNLDNTFRFISNASAPVAIGVPVFLLGMSLVEEDSLMRHKSYYIGATLASAAVLTTILKYSVNRERPFDKYPGIIKLSSAGSPSFPSGHTSDAFALATSLSFSYPKWYVIVPAYSWSCVVAFSRMDLGVHYPSDVLAGAVIGAGSAWLCHEGQRWLKEERGKKRK